MGVCVCVNERERERKRVIESQVKKCNERRKIQRKRRKQKAS